MEKELDTPILLMVFNRPDRVRLIFEAIRKVKPKKLFISADGPRKDRLDDIENCRLVREIVDKVDWPCDIKRWYREENFGCLITPSSAMSWFFQDVESGIILEDDCLPNTSFFFFCQELLERYKDNDRIMHINGSYLQRGNKTIHGDSYYFSNLAQIWGWATWRRAWKYYDMQIKSWSNVREEETLRSVLKDPAVYEYWERLYDNYYNSDKRDYWDRPWAYSIMLRKGLSITPKINLISNLGFGPTATHTINPDSEFSKAPTGGVDFPLVHPKVIEVDEEEDAFTSKHVFYIEKTPHDKIVGPIRRKYPKIYKKLKSVYRRYKVDKIF